MMGRQLIYTAISFFLICIFSFCTHAQNISVWLTNADRSVIFQKQDETLSFSSGKTNTQNIIVDDGKTFQTMDGFGFALTGGSAEHIIHMNTSARNELLHKIFDTTGNNIGVSY